MRAGIGVVSDVDAVADAALSSPRYVCGWWLALGRRALHQQGSTSAFRFYPDVPTGKGAPYVNHVLEERLFAEPGTPARAFMSSVYETLEMVRAKNE